MKKLIVLIMLLIFICSGCASFGSNQSYLEYLSAKKVQALAMRQPLLDLALTEDGRIASIKMYPQPVPFKIEQENPHPIYAVIGGALRVVGWVGLAWQIGDSMEGIIEASTGNTVVSNSYNDNSENAGSIDLVVDYSDSKTDTVDTTVETSE